MLSLLLVAAALSGHGTVWTGCEHLPRSRPARIVIACGDGNFYVDHLTWTSWKRSSATATGIGHSNDCTPNCAAGRFHAYGIAIRLSKAVSCVSGRLEFARISWTWAAQRPIPNGGQSLPCSFLKLKP